jgi:hypothetical protein
LNDIFNGSPRTQPTGLSEFQKKIPLAKLAQQPNHNPFVTATSQAMEDKWQ